ncbi:hypothetical protein EV182_003923 [Spiromyces aspiralis]|uniref:Uncharacterized protein n=1 Tax=Spiromyces aspiralis TaxID=68401 RepID=A0ACC1HPW9_9FUNG|nr:hypothetical protein EV182_003923 [Spiromyces aspiralis]
MLALYAICNRGQLDSDGFQAQLHNAFASLQVSVSVSATQDTLDPDTIKRHGLLEVYILLFRADSELQSGKIISAKATLEEVCARTTANGLLSCPKLQDQLMVRWAMYYQQTGATNMALDLYSQVVRFAKERDVRILAAIHQVALLLGQASAEDRPRVIEQVDILARSSEFTQDPGLKAAIEVIQGITAPEIIKSKAQTLNSLNTASAIANTQLQAITLTYMASLFLVTNPAQSEKMAAAALSVSSVSNNTLMGMLSGSLLEELLCQKGQTEQAERQRAQNAELKRQLASNFASTQNAAKLWQLADRLEAMMKSESAGAAHRHQRESSGV